MIVSKKLGIIGYGSFTRELLPHIKTKFDIFISTSFKNLFSHNELQYINNKYKCNIYSINLFDVNKYNALVTISNNTLRKHIIETELPKKTNYITFIDENAKLFDKNIKIGIGSIICHGTIITSNVSIGNFSQLNLYTTIGHDCIIDEYFTTAPHVSISGKCTIGKNVYIGTNSSIKEGINICDKVVIGLNSGIVKPIIESGIYIGTPACKIKSL